MEEIQKEINQDLKDSAMKAGSELLEDYSETPTDKKSGRIARRVAKILSKILPLIKLSVGKQK